MIPSAPLGTDAASGHPLGLGADAGSPSGEGAGAGRAAAERRFRFELAAHPSSPAQARRLARAQLTDWSVREDTCDSAALVVSELVTNAILHTASRRVVCELRDGEDLVRIAVRDEGCAPGEPHPVEQRPEEEHGRGIFLVAALCHAWGAHEHGSGLLVWAELRRGTDPPRPDGEPRDDLGWGARPKPGQTGPGDRDTAGTRSTAKARSTDAWPNDAWRNNAWPLDAGPADGRPVGTGHRRTDVPPSARRTGTGAVTGTPRVDALVVPARTHRPDTPPHTSMPLQRAHSPRSVAKPHGEPDHGTAAPAASHGGPEARDHRTGIVPVPFVERNGDRGRT